MMGNQLYLSNTTIIANNPTKPNNSNSYNKSNLNKAYDWKLQYNLTFVEIEGAFHKNKIK